MIGGVVEKKPEINAILNSVEVVVEVGVKLGNNLPQSRYFHINCLVTVHKRWEKLLQVKFVLSSQMLSL